MAVNPTEQTLIRIAQAMERIAKHLETLAYTQRDLSSTMRSIEQVLEHSLIVQSDGDDGNVP